MKNVNFPLILSIIQALMLLVVAETIMTLGVCFNFSLYDATAWFAQIGLILFAVALGWLEYKVIEKREKVDPITNDFKNDDRDLRGPTAL